MLHFLKLVVKLHVLSLKTKQFETYIYKMRDLIRQDTLRVFIHFRIKISKKIEIILEVELLHNYTGCMRNCSSLSLNI